MPSEAHRGVVYTQKMVTDPSVGEQLSAVAERAAHIQKMLGGFKLGGFDAGQFQTSVDRANAAFEAMQNRILSATTNGAVKRAAANGHAVKVQADLETSLTAQMTAEADKQATLPEKVIRNRIAMLTRLQKFEADKSQAERDAADQQIARLQKVTDAEQKSASQRGAANKKTVDDVIADWDRAEARKVAAGNKQLAALVKAGPQAQEQDRLGANQREADRERDAERAARNAEIGIRRQREEQTRQREEVISTTEAFTRLGEGVSYLGLIGERDLRKLADRLLAIQGITRAISGGAQVFGGLRGGAAGVGGIGGAGRMAGFGLGGTLLAGGAAALGLGLVQSSGGHGVADAARGGSQFLDSIYQRAQTFGMRPEERATYERKNLTTQEDVNKPRGFGMGDLFLPFTPEGMTRAAGPMDRQNQKGGRFAQLYDAWNADAANERNTERMRALIAQRMEQLDRRRRIEAIANQAEFERSDKERQQQEVDNEVENRRRQFTLRAEVTNFFFGERDKHRGLVTQEANTGIGRGGLFQPNTGFNDAGLIRDRGQRLEFLQHRRSQFVENEMESRRLGQRGAIVGRQIAEAKTQFSETSPENLEDRGRIKERINTLETERKQIVRETTDLRLRMNQQDLADSAKLLQLTVQRANTAKERLNTGIQSQQSMQERLGMMNPIQFQALFQARQRAEAGHDLPREEIEILEGGDSRSQLLAAQAKRKRFHEMAGRIPGADKMLGSQEAFETRTAAAQAEQLTGQQTGLAKEISGVTNQLVLSGNATITLDVRHDLGLIEEASDLERSIVKTIGKNLEPVYKAIEAAKHEAAGEAMRQIRQQGSVGNR